MFKKLFGWLDRIADFFRSDRWREVKRVFPVASKVATDLAEVFTAEDWDNDGHVRSREELASLLDRLDREVGRKVFPELYDAAGRVEAWRVRWMTNTTLKKTLAVAVVVSALIERGQMIPGYSILDSAVQLAYEASKK
jgi:hypothetical protein